MLLQLSQNTFFSTHNNTTTYSNSSLQIKTVLTAHNFKINVYGKSKKRNQTHSHIAK